MAEKGPWELIDEADNRTIAGSIAAVAASIVLALGQGINSVINTGFDLFVDPLAALIDGSVGTVNELWGGWQDILRQGAQTTVQAIEPGATWAIGPLTQALSIATVFAGLYIVAWFIAQPWTSNLVPGTLVDNRFVSFISETPEEEEN